MLYVSRVLSRSRVCVCDSEDGVEDILGAEELVKYVRDLGIEIKGISLDVRGGKTRVFADPYQPPTSITASQSKCMMLNGVEILVTNDVICCIRWSKSSIPSQPVRIRLSDYGKSCANYLFWWQGLCQNTSLTLVFDDNITITSKSLVHIEKLGVRCDITEVTDQKMVDKVYRSVSGKRGYHQNAIQVIDTFERGSLYKAIGFLNSGIFLPTSMQGVYTDQKIVDEIAKRFGSEFKSIADCSFAFNGKADVYSNYIRFIHTIEGYAYSGAGFYTLRDVCSTDLREILAKYTTCNAGVVYRFCNYVKNFSVIPKDIQEAFVKFASRAIEFLVDSNPYWG